MNSGETGRGEGGGEREMESPDSLEKRREEKVGGE